MAGLRRLSDPLNVLPKSFNPSDPLNVFQKKDAATSQPTIAQGVASPPPPSEPAPAPAIGRRPRERAPTIAASRRQGY
jgi:hypothetical protein